MMTTNSFITILLTAALLQSVAAGNYQTGGSYVQFDSCACDTTDLQVTETEFCNPATNKAGSQARTWQNLCGGSRGNVATFDDDDNVNDNDAGDQDFFNIDQRVGDPFRRLCLLIGQYPNVRDFLGRGYSPHTIFAPTDSAFNKVDGIVGQIDEQKLLEIHILPEARLLFDLHCGQTVRTLNTDNLQKNNQKTKTKCVTGGITEQLGPGNYKAGHKPRIGTPNNIFNAWQFQNQQSFTNLKVKNSGQNPTNIQAGEGSAANGYNYLFSADVISCNGIIQVVDNVILPGNSGFGGTNGYQSSGGNIGGYYGRSNGGYYGGSTYRSGYYGGGKGGGAIAGKGGYYNSRGKGGSSYYGGGKGSVGKGGYFSQGKGGYRSIGKGLGKGIGYGGYGGKGAKGYGHKGGKGYYKGGKGYGGYGYKGSKGYGGVHKYGGGGAYRGGYGGGYYRRDLENEEGGFADDYDVEGEEHVDFLSPDFEEGERYGYDDEDEDDDEDYDYGDEDDDEDEENSIYFGQFAAQAINEMEASKSAAAATEEKFKKRKQRLEALLEPNGNIAPVAE